MQQYKVGNPVNFDPFENAQATPRPGVKIGEPVDFDPFATQSEQPQPEADDSPGLLTRAYQNMNLSGIIPSVTGGENGKYGLTGGVQAGPDDIAPSIVRGLGNGGLMLAQTASDMATTLPGTIIKSGIAESERIDPISLAGAASAFPAFRPLAKFLPGYHAGGGLEPTRPALKKTLDEAGDILLEAGKTGREFYGDIRKDVDQAVPESRRGKDFIDDPGLLLNPSYLAEASVESIVSMVPPLVAAFAGGGPAVAGAIGGGMEGLGALGEMLDDGMQPDEALIRSGAYGTASAALNAYSFGKILDKQVVDGLIKKGAKILGASGVEAFTEWLEGPVQTLAQYTGTLPMVQDGSTALQSAGRGLDIARTQNDPQDIVSALTKAGREEAAVIPGSFIAGGGSAMLAPSEGDFTFSEGDKGSETRRKLENNEPVDLLDAAPKTDQAQAQPDRRLQAKRQALMNAMADLQRQGQAQADMPTTPDQQVIEQQVGIGQAPARPAGYYEQPIIGQEQVQQFEQGLQGQPGPVELYPVDDLEAEWQARQAEQDAMNQQARLEAEWKARAGQQPFGGLEMPRRQESPASPPAVGNMPDRQAQGLQAQKSELPPSSQDSTVSELPDISREGFNGEGVKEIKDWWGVKSTDTIRQIKRAQILGEDITLAEAERRGREDAARRASERESSLSGEGKVESNDPAEQQKQEPLGGKQTGRQVADFTVDTEDLGSIRVSVIRDKDGSVSIFTDKNTIEYNAAFASEKSDEDLLKFAFEPSGFKGVSKATDSLDQKSPGPLGKNRRGLEVGQDERGVRYYDDGGIRVMQTVGVIPGGGIKIDTPERLYALGGSKLDFLTADELERFGQQENAAQPQTTPTRDEYADLFDEELAAATAPKPKKPLVKKTAEEKAQAAASRAQREKKPLVKKPKDQPTTTATESNADLKGFSKLDGKDGSFTLSDGNMEVRVSPVGGGKFQAAFRSAKSTPHLRGVQDAVDWAAAIRDESLRTESKAEGKEVPVALTTEGAKEAETPHTSIARMLREIADKVEAMGTGNGKKPLDTKWAAGAIKRHLANSPVLSGKQLGEFASAKIAVSKAKTPEDLRNAAAKLEAAQAKQERPERPNQEKIPSPTERAANKGLEKKKVARWFDAVRAWTNGEKFANVRPDIVERAWDDDSLVKRSEIGAFVDWLEKNKVDSYRIERMRRIIETLKGERTGKYYITIHKGVHGPDRIEMKIDANGDGVSESSEYVATMEDARRTGKQKGLEHALDGDGSPSISYLRGNTVVSHKPNSTAKIEKTDDGYRFFYSDTGMTVDKKTIFDMKEFLNTQFFDGWQAMRADFDRLKNDGAIDEAAESRAEMMSVNIFDLKKLAADLKITVEKDATKEWIVSAILDAKSPDVQPSKKTPDQRAAAVQDKPAASTQADATVEQKTDFAEEINKIYRVLNLGQDAYTFGDNKGQQFRNAKGEAMAMLKAYKKKYGWSDEFAREVWKKASQDMVGPGIKPATSGPVQYTDTPSPEWVQINRDKSVKTDIPEAQKEKLTLKQQKAWLLAEIDKAMKSDAKGGKPFEFHVPGDGHFRIKPENLKTFRETVVARFPEKERPSALGKTSPKGTRDPKARVNEGEYYNEWQDYEVKVDSVIKQGDKDLPFPAWDSKTNALYDGVSLVVLDKKPLIKGLKDSTADTASFIKHSEKEVTERAEIVGQFKRQGLDVGEDHRRENGNKKTRDMLNELANDLSKVFAHVRYGDKDAFFPAERVDMLRTQFPDADLRVDKAGSRLGFFKHGKLLGMTMAVQGIEFSDYHKARIEEIKAKKEGRYVGDLAAKTAVETPALTKEEQEGVDLLAGLAKGEIKADGTEAEDNPVTGRTRWFVAYSERNTGRTTELKSFATLAEAREFAQGKHGYISKQEDKGSGLGTDQAENTFKEYFGGFEPSAQEGQSMKSLFGEVPATARVEANAGMRKATKAGQARVDEAKKAMAAIVNNPDIVGKDRADRIENARNLIHFLETNAANDLDTGYEFGDQVAYTGDEAPEGMRAFIYLEGAKAGKTGVAATPEARTARAERAQEDWKKGQDEFRRIREAKEGGEAKSEAKKPAEKIEDFGEKIGGARKDTASSTGRTRAKKERDESPAWSRRYEVNEIAKSTKPEEEGKFVIIDTKIKDRWRDHRASKQFFNTREEAERAIPLVAVARNHRVRQREDGYVIMKDVSDRKTVQVVAQKFATREEAMRYMAEHAAEILEIKTVFGEEIIERPDAAVRVGVERRTAPATAEDFQSTFGFRGVEFGNWNNQEERQEVMNHAYDGLLDLAEVLGIPPKAISLNGDLALAFGARGQGLSGAKAHYELDYGVINLTKMSGAGSLAHEWFHAVDHYLGRQDGKASGKKVTNNRGDDVYDAKGAESDMVSHGFGYKSTVREELRTAFNKAIDAMKRKAEKYVEDAVSVEKWIGTTREQLAGEIAKVRKNLASQLDPKWYKRNNKPASADQLKQFDLLADRLLSGEGVELEYVFNEGGARSKFGYGYRTNDTLNAMAEIYKAVRGRSGFKSDKNGVFDGISSYLDRYLQRIETYKSAQANEEKTRSVPTQFLRDSKTLDQGRKGSYFALEHEMAARAFSAYVQDRLTAQQQKSEFLVYGTKTIAPTPWGFVPVFPLGEERVAINDAFDSLVKELKTKETDKGVALYQVKSGATPLVETPAFKKWFGKSKAHGVFYHWTNNVFDSFSKTSDIGFHFGTEASAKDRGSRIGGAEIGVEPVEVARIDADTKAALNGPLTGNPASDLYALLLRKLDSPRPDLESEIEKMTTEDLEAAASEYRDKPDSPKAQERAARAAEGGSFRVVANGEVLSTHKTPREARARADKLRRDAAKPMAVYLRVENPIRLPDLGVWPAQEIAKESGFTREEMDAVALAGDEQAQYAKVREILMAKGHDGIVYTNQVEDIGTDSYIVFDPTQIKSVNNRGTFDPSDPRIQYQKQDAVAPTPIDLRAAFPWADEITQDGDKHVVTKGKTSFVVKLVDSIAPDKVAFELEYQRAFNPKTDQISGQYKGATITVSRSAGNQWTLSHEFEHFLEDMGLITRFEQAVLDAAIKKQEKAGTLPFDAAPTGKRMGNAELRAYFVQHALELRDWDRKTPVGRILQKIADFIDALVNLHHRTARGIVRDVESGRVMDREQGGKRKFRIPMLQAAWHGSPYRFSRFSLDHMGSGEGAQAFGWGLYFAEKKEIAEYYREIASSIRSGGAWSYTQNPVFNPARGRWMFQAYQNMPTPGSVPQWFNTQQEAIDFVEAKNDKGQLYRAEIPEDEVMLHWDRPLSEQPEKVKVALMGMMKSWVDIPNGDDLAARMKYHFNGRDVRGDFIYDLLAKKYGTKKEMTGGWTAEIKDDKAASEYLNSIGIKGIKYLDGSSRGAGEGSYNYVIFDDSAIEILETFYQAKTSIWGKGPVPVVTVQAGADPSLAEAQQALRALRGSSVVNEDTGWEIGFSKRGLGKTESHQASAESRIGAVRLREMTEKAVLVATEENRDETAARQVRFVHHFYVPMRMGGALALARIVVKETPQGQKYYDSIVAKMEKPEAGYYTGYQDREAAATGSSIMSIRTLLEMVKVVRPDHYPAAEDGDFEGRAADTHYQLAGMNQVKRHVEAAAYRPETFGRLNFIHTQVDKALKSPQFRMVFDRVSEMARTVSASASSAASLAEDILPSPDKGFVATLKDVIDKGRFADNDLKEASVALSAASLAGDSPSPFDGRVFTEDELLNGVEIHGKTYRLSPDQVEAYRQTRAAVNKSVWDLATSEAWKRIRPFVNPGLWQVFADNSAMSDVRMEALMYDALDMAERDAKAAQAAVLAQAGVRDLEHLDAHEKELTKFIRKIRKLMRDMKKAEQSEDAMEKIEAIEEKMDRLESEYGMSFDDALEDLKALRKAQRAHREATKKVANIEGTIHDVFEEDGIFDKARRLQAGGYMPLMRFGAYEIRIEDEDGRGVAMYRFDSSTEAKLAYDELVAQYGNQQGVTVSRPVKINTEAWKRFKDVSPDSILLFAKESDFGSDQALQEIWRKLYSDRSSMKRLIRRKGIPGYSDDLQRILSSFITSNARRIAANYHAAPVEQLITDIGNNDVQQEAQKVFEFFQGSGDPGSWFRSFAAHLRLLGSPMTAAINGTQVFTSTFPELVKHGATTTEALGRIIRAYRDSFKKDPARMTADEEWAIAKGVKDGTIDSAEIFHLYGMGTQTLIDKIPGGRRIKRSSAAALRARGMMFAWTEKLNRHVTVLSAFRMFRDQGMNREDAYLKAREVADVTQGRYGKENRPNLGRNPIAGAMLTFMQYKIMTLEQIIRNARGNRQAKKAAALQILVLLMLGGLGGVPFAEDAMDLLDIIMQTLFGRAWLTRDKLKKAVRNMGEAAAGALVNEEAGKMFGRFASEVFDKGISGLPGMPMDVSGRYKVGGTIPGLKVLKPSTKFRESAVLDMFGVPGGMIDDAVRAIGLALDGEPWRGAKLWLPSDVQNYLKGADIAATGKIKDSAGRTITEGDMLDASLQILGAQPRAKTVITSPLWEKKELLHLTQKTESDFVRRYAEARADGDEAAFNAVRAEQDAWNKNNPDWPIKITQMQIRKAMMDMNMTTEQRQIRMTPREARKNFAPEVQ